MAPWFSLVETECPSMHSIFRHHRYFLKKSTITGIQKHIPAPFNLNRGKDYGTIKKGTQ
jgi:hypothetical protein